MKERVSPTQRALNVWAIVLIVWSIYRAYFGTSLPELFDELIAKPVIFLFPIFYYITRKEKKDFWEGIDAKFKNIREDALLGVAIGAIFIVTAAFSHWIKFSSFDKVIDKIMSPESLLLFIILAFASSISEEILSRGFILQRLYNESKNTMSSVLFASLLFFFLHIPILFTMPEVNGTTLLQVMFTDFVLSMAVSIIYLQRRDVFLPILIHAFYNISIYLFLAS